MRFNQVKVQTHIMQLFLSMKILYMIINITAFAKEMLVNFRIIQIIQ